MTSKGRRVGPSESALVSRFKQSFSSDYWIASLDSPEGGIWVWLTVTLKFGVYFICGFRGKT